MNAAGESVDFAINVSCVYCQYILLMSSDVYLF